MAVPHDTGGLTWSLEPSHFPAAPTRWTAHLFVTIQTEVLRRVTAEAGLPVDGLAMREFDGRVYTVVVPLGGKARKPPPAALVPLLCKVVPELRRRVAASNRWEREDRPAQIIEEWFGGKEAALLDEGRTFFRLDLEHLSGVKLAEAIDRAIAYAEDALFWHFYLHGAAVWQIGRLGMQLEAEHGWSDAEFAALFTGLSSTSTGPAAAQRALLDLIDEQDARNTLARAESLEDLRVVSAPLRNAIDDYLDNWGLRAIRYEVAYPMVAERPEWLLRQLQEQARASDEDHSAAHAAARAAAERRLLADLGDTEETRTRLETARHTFPVRESNETATVGLPVAALRHVGLEAGRRLARVGNLERPDDVFDLTINEVTAALRGAPNSPGRSRVACAHATRGTPRRRRDPTSAHGRTTGGRGGRSTLAHRLPPGDRRRHEGNALVRGQGLRRPATRDRRQRPHQRDPGHSCLAWAVRRNGSRLAGRVASSSASNRATCSCARSPHRSGRWCSPRSVHSCAMPAGR